MAISFKPQCFHPLCYCSTLSHNRYEWSGFQCINLTMTTETLQNTLPNRKCQSGQIFVTDFIKICVTIILTKFRHWLHREFVSISGEAREENFVKMSFPFRCYKCIDKISVGYHSYFVLHVSMVHRIALDNYLLVPTGHHLDYKLLRYPTLGVCLDYRHQRWVDDPVHFCSGPLFTNMV